MTSLRFAEPDIALQNERVGVRTVIILWERARRHEKAALDALRSYLTIEQVFEIEWTEDREVRELGKITDVQFNPETLKVSYSNQKAGGDQKEESAKKNRVAEKQQEEGNQTCPGCRGGRSKTGRGDFRRWRTRRTDPPPSTDQAPKKTRYLFRCGIGALPLPE